MRFTPRLGWRVSKKDVLDADTTLNQVIAAVVRKFKEEYILCKWKTVPLFKSLQEAEPTDEDVEAFIADLDTIILAFEAPSGISASEVVRGRELLIKYYDSFWL